MLTVLPVRPRRDQTMTQVQLRQLLCPNMFSSLVSAFPPVSVTHLCGRSFTVEEWFESGHGYVQCWRIETLLMFRIKTPSGS